MLKNYELLYIVHPDLEGSTEKIVEKVNGFIERAGGKVTSHEDLGKRKLAYKISKNDFGVYELTNFSLESVELAKVERDLRLSEEIMRSMIVAIPEISEVKAAKKKPRLKREEVEAKKEELANIIVSEEKSEKPAKKTTKKAEKTEEVVEEVVAEEVKEEKKPVKKTAKKVTEKPEKTDETTVAEAKTDKKAEEERLKKLDEKLDELLK